MELKPCPFCGSSVMYLCTNYDRIGIEMNTVFCNSCKTSFSNEDVEDDELGTREWWNEKRCTTSAERTCTMECIPTDWLDEGLPSDWKCSECGEIFTGGEMPNYCFNCGAKVVE